MIEKLEEWKGKNLEIFWLPSYSPKHKLIDIILSIQLLAVSSQLKK